ncbi:ATP-binding protein [Maribacter halichondriae]|uniref:ATP-binding protein n=1 Tax=Maribacter halichondriae TaxID=2980554 RepID=UPI0023598A85|nr:ATP-binding protein [Maribacter sp. Hal144]
MSAKKIVITGGPSTGKTSLIKGLQNAGHFCYPEVIRQMTLEAKDKGALINLNTNPIAAVSNPLDFNRKILDARLAHYKDSLQLKDSINFFDRGMPDVLAYMTYYKQSHPKEFISIVKKSAYDMVFVLPMWRDIFVQDDERFESYEDALKIHDCLVQTYNELNYDVIEVPKYSIQERLEFILQKLKG